MVRREFIKKESIQPIYYPSINKKNLDDFKKNFLMSLMSIQITYLY